MSESVVLWSSFNLLVLMMLALDLGVFHRKSHKVGLKEALTWTGVWITLAMVFNLFVYYYFDKEKAIEFFTGYLIEKSLSCNHNRANCKLFILTKTRSLLPAFWECHCLNRPYHQRKHTCFFQGYHFSNMH